MTETLVTRGTDFVGDSNTFQTIKGLFQESRVISVTDRVVRNWIEERILIHVRERPYM